MSNICLYAQWRYLLRERLPVCTHTHVLGKIRIIDREIIYCYIVSLHMPQFHGPDLDPNRLTP